MYQTHVVASPTFDPSPQVVLSFYRKTSRFTLSPIYLELHRDPTTKPIPLPLAFRDHWRADVVTWDVDAKNMRLPGRSIRKLHNPSQQTASSRR